MVKRLKIFRWLFGALLITTFIAGIAALSLRANTGAGDGNWANVCCGASCGVDYCLGSGSYTCCK